MTESTLLTKKLLSHDAQTQQQEELSDELLSKEENASSEPQQQRSNILQLYRSNNIIDANLKLNSAQHELHVLQQLVQHKIYYVQRMASMLNKIEDSPKYVATVLSVLSNRLAKVKLGVEQFVLPTAPGLHLRPNSRVGVEFTLSGDMRVYRELPKLHDPLVSLMLVQKSSDTASYEMIGGLKQQIQAIREVVELPIVHPELFSAVGIEQPKGVLLYGPPGTGKTLLARAVANHAKCAFFRLSGTELVQKYIGDGARMVRELFVMARERAPAIIFLDEVDSIGGSRSTSDAWRHDSSSCEQTMVELLNQVDGFEPAQNIKVILATNRIDTLDDALLRPGRVDRKIFFPAPGLQERADILRVHSHRMSLGRCVNFNEIADLTPGASGAELKLLCQEAAFGALREGRTYVQQDDFVQKIAKVMENLAQQEPADSSVK